MKSIQLLIDDRRRSEIRQNNTSQRIGVKCIDSEDCIEGEWHANASEILTARQKSLGRLLGPRGSSNSANPARTSRGQSLEPRIEWLKQKISTQPGYTKFHSNRNKVLHNIERVAFWRFVSDTKREFHKRNWPAEISSHALQMSSTAFSKAVQMMGIIDFYTAEGANYGPEFATEITKTGDSDPNAPILRTFLLQWEQEHGVASNEENN
ncbi:hypothetical protein B0H11DRAFT_1902469 [Mycena galericulata]|nr:hypothetical protein B0H11DRAFT_1902469 [Mycena galericulata]